MKLHYSAPVLVFILLLFGIVGSALSQSTSFLFGSTRGMPTRLFGSTYQLGGESTCAQKTSYGCGSSYGYEQKSYRRPLRASTISRGCKPACGCEASCDCLPSKSCGTECQPNPCRRCGVGSLAGVLGKLDVAVKGLFGCNRSACCDPCCYQTQCCAVQPFYGYEAGCGCEPGEYSMPVPGEQLETPSLEGDPFEDDPDQLLAPPLPSEARRGPGSRSPIGTVTYTRPTSRIGTISPARFRPDTATPIKRPKCLTRSLLDRVD